MFLQTIIWLQTRLAQERERGATAVEYGMLVALIAAFLVAAIVLLRDAIAGAFNSVVSAL